MRNPVSIPQALSSHSIPGLIDYPCFLNELPESSRSPVSSPSVGRVMSSCLCLRSNISAGEKIDRITPLARREAAEQN